MRGIAGPPSPGAPRTFGKTLLLLELPLLAIQSALQDHAILPGLRIDRVHLGPGDRAVEDHLADLGSKGGGGCRGVLELLHVLDMEACHGSNHLLLSVLPAVSLRRCNAARSSRGPCCPAQRPEGAAPPWVCFPDGSHGRDLGRGGGTAFPKVRGSANVS